MGGTEEAGVTHGEGASTMLLTKPGHSGRVAIEILLMRKGLRDGTDL